MFLAVLEARKRIMNAYMNSDSARRSAGSSDEGTSPRCPTLLHRILKRAGGETDAFLGWIRGRMGDLPNDLTLRVFAQRRSGHHAIINWLRLNTRGRHWFLNHCKPGRNPFEGADLSTSLIRGHWSEHRTFKISREKKGNFSHKGTLIYNFEEVDFSEGHWVSNLADEEIWIGPSLRRADVLVIRDPFNLLASKLKWAYGQEERPSKPTLDDVRKGKELWKICAREYLGKTEFLEHRININYNKWFTDKDYRDDLGQKFGFTNRDRGLLKVAKWGPSTSRDSFDGLEFDGRAQMMGVLERWRHFSDDPFFRELCRDPEVHELSNEIFGELPDTQALKA